MDWIDDLWGWVVGYQSSFWPRIYRGGVLVFGGLAFMTAWVVSWFVGGFMGFMAGWLPSLIVGAIVGFLWPLLFLIVAIAAAGIWVNNTYFL